MSGPTLERAVRTAGGRIVASLAVRFRDLDIAEDAFADACARAIEAWQPDAPRDPVGWLYRVALRRALDALRRKRTRERLRPEPPEHEPSAEDRMTADDALIPDDRLRLIFVCCHPAVAVDARAALTLRLVCGLSTAEIASAFLLSEPTLAQRLVRAKRKIAEAGIPFDIPPPAAWPERLEGVLTTLEVAYSKAHEDAAGVGPHAGYALEMLELTRLLAALVPGEPEVMALAALVRYAEARRPARLDAHGLMVPLSEQDPARWQRPLIEEADSFLERATALGPLGPRSLQAAIHAAWCGRRNLTEAPPWLRVLALYDALLAVRDDPVVRLNRAVALAEVAGVAAALAELDGLSGTPLQRFLPYQAVRADLLRRAGRNPDARAAYDAALGLGPTHAERLWLEERRRSLA